MSKKKTKKTGTQKNEKHQLPPKVTAKIPLFPIAIVLIAVLGIGFFTFRANKTDFVNVKDVNLNKTSNVETVQNTSSTETNAAKFENLQGGETKPVLSPVQFTGKTASSYKVARENPELLDAMYCYCYCKKTIGHKSLLSCFADKHASKCTICQDQAFYAKILQDKGFDIGQIRKEVDRKFWRPFS